ncbi:MAG: RHS repeat-associated core domain-containing protein [Elusimicrobia bacterium]|nr:RHS repeat-associated core domain-containing protein [Elusimicrobiota bacterium]
MTDVGFTGHRMDGDGLIYMKARYYDPGLGRFLTPDSIVQDAFDPQTLNRYTYVRDNPVNLVDPTGHKWHWWREKMEKPAHKVVRTKWFNYTMGTVCVAVGAVVSLGGSPWIGYEIAALGGGYFYSRAGANVDVPAPGYPVAQFGGGAAWNRKDTGDISITGMPFPTVTQPAPARSPQFSIELSFGGETEEDARRKGEVLTLAEAGLGDYISAAERTAARVAARIRDYGSVDVNFNAGNGVLGLMGVSLLRVPVFWMGGVGIGVGISVGPSVNIGQSAAWAHVLNIWWICGWRIGIRRYQ